MSNAKRKAHAALSLVKPTTAKRPRRVTTEDTVGDPPVAKEKTIKVAKKAKVQKERKPVVKLQAYDIKKNGTMSARGLACLCGCGTPTQTVEARFVSGHDSTLRQALLGGNPIPEIIRPFFEHGETIAGVALVKGKIVDRKASRTADEGDEGE